MELKSSPLLGVEETNLYLGSDLTNNLKGTYFHPFEHRGKMASYALGTLVNPKFTIVPLTILKYRSMGRDRFSIIML